MEVKQGRITSPQCEIHTPLKAEGRPVYEDVWKYLLGINCGLTDIHAIANSCPKLYPNPVNESFYVQNNNGTQVVIYNLKGQFLLTKTIGLEEKFEVNELPSGMYNAVIIDINGQNVQIKFIKL